MSYQARLRVPVSREDHSDGPENAPLILIEYGDYECPHCGRAFPIVRDLRRELGNDLLFIFRNFPLSEVHPQAMAAAKAAEAAGLQGRFWDMHNALFENPDRLDQDSLVEFAGIMGMDPYRFAIDMERPEVERRILKDIEGGVRSGVNGTPTFFVNGSRFDGRWDEGELRESLIQAVASI